MPRSSSEYGTNSESAGCGEEKCTTVAIRLRPLNDRERAGKQNRIWRCVPTHSSITQTTPDGNPLPDTKGSTFFTYDRIFDEDSTTQQVYEGVAQDIVRSVVRGLNGTIFAYGQTSSGKTFTMQGDDRHDTPGIVQLAARDLFRQMEQAPDRMFLMRVSYLEIYQEDVKDLLNPESSKLQVREDPRKGVYIEAHEEVVSDFGSVLNILNAGEKQRHVGCTEMNNRSSRSHTMFRLVIESQEHYVSGIHESPEDVDPAVLVATLNLVDLAGSESVRHTGATGQRQKEGGKINQSLLTLSRVIQTLSQGGSAHVNYRDSKLTRILQPSLSGNAGMAIICCATAAEGYLEETRSTLQFASRAKEIKTRAIVNEVLDDKAQLRRMSRELAALKRKQAEAGNGSALVETLQAEKAEQAAKIERLNNLLINLAPVDEVGELHLVASPRYRRTKRSRETWCPGEGGVPLPLSLLDSNFPKALDIGVQDFGKSRKQKRSISSVSTPASTGCSVPRTSTGRSVPRSPLSPLVPRDPTTPGFMSPARARAQQEVADMREKLSALQTERDAKAAEAAAAEAEISRVRQLEAEVVQREQEVCSLKEQLDAASKAAAGAAAAATTATEAGASNSRKQVDDITAQLAKAMEAKESLEEELTEFGEYTDMMDKKMMEMKVRTAAVEESLRQKEAELAAIRAAEEEEEARNAGRVDELQSYVKELEAAIQDRREEDDGMLADLKAALEASQKELAEFKTRANEAEAEQEKLMGELSYAKDRLGEERDAAERVAQEAANAVAAANRAAEEASRRERECASAAEERILVLEAEKGELEEQEAELRAQNDAVTLQLTVEVERITTEREKHEKLEEDWKTLHDENENMLSEKRKLAQERDSARVDAESLRANVAALSSGLDGRLAMLSEELSAASAEITRLAAELAMSKEHTSVVQSQLEAKDQEVLALKTAAEDLNGHLAAVEAATSERIEAAEMQSKVLKDQLADALAAAERAATEAGELKNKAASADELMVELETTRQTLVTIEKEAADAASRFEAETEGIRTALELAEASVSSKEEEITSLRQNTADQLQEAQAEADGLASELEAARRALEVNGEKLVAVASEREAETEDIRAALERAESSLSSKEEEIANFQQAADELRESQVAKVDSLVTELEAVHQAMEAYKEEMAAVASEYEDDMKGTRDALKRAEEAVLSMENEIENIQKQAEGEQQSMQSIRDKLEAELETTRQALEVREKQIGEITPKYEIEAKDMRAALERSKALVTAMEEENACALQKAADELQRSQAKADGLALELDATRDALDSGKMEMEAFTSKCEVETKTIREALERAETLVSAKKDEIGSLRQLSAHELEEAKARAAVLASELEIARQAVEASENNMTVVTLKHEAEVENIRAALVRAEAMASAKEEEIPRLLQQAEEKLRETQTKAGNLASDLEIARQAMVASEKELAAVSTKNKAETEDMRAELALAKASTTTKEDEVARLIQDHVDELQEAQDKADGLVVELETARQAVEIREKEVAEAASKYKTELEGMHEQLERATTSETAKTEEIANLRRQVMDEVVEAQAKADVLVAELETAHQTLESNKMEMTSVVSKYEAEIVDMRAALEHSQASVLSKEEEVADLLKQTTDELQETKAREGCLESEVETLRDALETGKEQMAEVASKHETQVATLRQQAAAELQEAQDKASAFVAELEAARQALEAKANDMRAALERAEASASMKDEEVSRLMKQGEDQLQEAQARVDCLASELETAREAGEEEMANVTSEHEAEMVGMRVALERAELSASSKGEKDYDLLQQVTDELREVQAKAVDLASELVFARRALEMSEKERAAVTLKYEAEMEDIREAFERAKASASANETELENELRKSQVKADDSMSELETARRALEVSEDEMAAITLKHEAETEDMRAQLELAEASVLAKEEEITTLLQQEADELRESQAKADSLEVELKTALKVSEEEMVAITSKHEAETEGMGAQLKLVEASVLAKEEEIATLLEEAADDLGKSQAKATSLEVELETARRTMEAREKGMADIISEHEAEMEDICAGLERAEVSTSAKEAEIEDKLRKSQTKSDSLASELETARRALEVREEEMAVVVSKHEAETEDMRAQLELAGASVLAKEEEIATLLQQGADDLRDSQTKANSLELELETTRQALEARAKDMTDVISKYEAETEGIRAGLERAEVSTSAKEAEIEDELRKSQTKSDSLASELETARRALEVMEEEMAVVVLKHEAETEDMRAQLELAEASVLAKEEEIATLLQQAADELRESQAKANSLELELETARQALEAREKDMTDAISKHEAETEGIRAGLERAEVSTSAKEAEIEDELRKSQTKSDSLASELETARRVLEANEEEMAVVVSKHEAEAEDMRAQLELAEASVLAKEEEIATLLQQAADDLRESQAKADGLESDLNTARQTLEDMIAQVERTEKLVLKEEKDDGFLQQVADELREAQANAEEAKAAASARDDVIAELKERLQANEALQSDLAQALDDSENLSREVLDLTDQIMEKEARLSAQENKVTELRQQLDSVSSAFEALKEKSASSVVANANDGFSADASDELRHLKVELDMKGSELDMALKEGAEARAELKEMKGMFNAAEAGAGAAGADEVSLRKRISQLECERGLLRGEKDRFETVAAAAATEKKTSAARTAAEIERLEREVSGLRERAEKASGAMADTDRTKMALQSMEARLSQVLQQRADLQESSKRSLDRCSAAETELEVLRARLAEIEGRHNANGTVAMLETRIDELEEEMRRAEASKAEMEGAAHESANRVKRLQREVDMMRSEYELVSEEAAGLRGTLAAAEMGNASAQHEADDRLEQLEADISRLREERAELAAAHGSAIHELEAQVSAGEEALRDAKRRVAKLEDDVGSHSTAAERACRKARAAEEAVTAAEDDHLAAEADLADAERRLAEAIKAGKATEKQLRHRLEGQVAEAENLRQKLAASNERCEQVEAAVRAFEEDARDGADQKTKELLSEMENLYQEKLLAENKVGEMQSEVERLRADVASSATLAAEEQHAIIAASKQHIRTLEQAAAAKQEAIEELQASLDAAHEAVNTAGAEVPALKRQVEEYEEIIEQKNARISRLEGVRLTRDQVEKLSTMKLNARKTAAENKELSATIKKLKQRLTATEIRAQEGRRSAEAGGAGVSKQAAALALANERIEELQELKSSLMQRCQSYGKKIYELERQHMRVRAAIERAGVLAPEGCDLGDAVLEIASRAAGADDASVVSGFSSSEAAALASAVAASESHQAELQEAKAALRREEAERLTVQEQMRAGVSKYRALEATVVAAGQQLAAAAADKRETVNAALKMKEKDHDRQLKYLQEENVNLFRENAKVKADADKFRVELETVKSKVAVSSQPLKTEVPDSATKKKVCADRTNIENNVVEEKVPAQPASAKKAKAATQQPTAAAARRARSRSLLEGPTTADESGECKQS